jgi:hypothetical protein
VPKDGVRVVQTRAPAPAAREREFAAA